MSESMLTNKEWGRGRNWDVLPADEGPVPWSLDTDQGLIQGPLDLEFLRGQCICLDLAPGQMALVIQDGDVRTIYLDGVHYLDIGPGEGRIPPDCGVIFLAADHSIDMKWPADQPLELGTGMDTSLIGHCSLAIEGPHLFHDTFLRGADGFDSEFTVRLIEQMVRAAFEEILGDFCSAGLQPASVEFQSRLTNLVPEDLTLALEASGLACNSLAVFTAAPPRIELGEGKSASETAGHPVGVGHN